MNRIEYGLPGEKCYEHGMMKCTAQRQDNDIDTHQKIEQNDGYAF
jgi:hypothetical protein